MRDILHIKDACEIILIQIKKIKKINNKTFNIGGEIKNSISLNDLTNKCEKLTKNKIKFKSISKHLFDIPYYVSDNNKLKNFINGNPRET